MTKQPHGRERHRYEWERIDGAEGRFGFEGAGLETSYARLENEVLA